MNGYQNTALSYAAVKAFRFIFRDSHTDQGSNQSSDGASNTHPGQGCHNRSGRDKRAEAWNR